MAPDSFLVPAYRTEKFTVAYKTCLQHFSHAAGKFLHRQASQCLHIHVYKAGLMKSAHHILVLAEINARFSSHATVHLGKQCRRNLYKVDPPEICGRAETCQVARNASPQSRQKAFPVHFIDDQGFVQFLDGIKILAGLSGRKRKQKNIRTYRRKYVLNFFCIKRRCVAVCNNTDITAVQAFFFYGFCQLLKIIFKKNGIGEFALPLYIQNVFCHSSLLHMLLITKQPDADPALFRLSVNTVQNESAFSPYRNDIPFFRFIAIGGYEFSVYKNLPAFYEGNHTVPGSLKGKRDK